MGAPFFSIFLFFIRWLRPRSSRWYPVWSPKSRLKLALLVIVICFESRYLPAIHASMVGRPFAATFTAVLCIGSSPMWQFFSTPNTLPIHLVHSVQNAIGPLLPVPRLSGPEIRLVYRTYSTIVLLKPHRVGIRSRHDDLRISILGPKGGLKY